jgi:aspartokinase
MPTTTELTEKYLSKHPSILDCLKNGIVNYSKLSRKIAKELDIEKKTSLEAILIACRRYEAKIKNGKILENKILKILKESELEIKNKIAVTIVDKRKYLWKIIEIENKLQKSADTFYAIEGSKVFTIITTEKHLQDLKTLFGNAIIKTSRNLAMITIKSPKELENTPGVNAFVYSKFREHGINIVEQMSCWTDTIVVISENDIPTVMSFLRF